MSTTSKTSIVVKVQHRGESKTIFRSEREAFWGELIFTAKSLKTKEQSQEVLLDDIDLLEARIEHDLGPAIRAKMIRLMVEDPLALLNDHVEDSSKTEQVLLHLGFPKTPLGFDPAAVIKLASDEIEYLRQRNADTSHRSLLNNRVVTASSVFFSVKVAGYDSLLLELAVAPTSSLVDLFHGDVMAFKTFLESSLPELFTGCLPSKFRLGTSKLHYMVTLQDSFASAFAVTPANG